MSPTLALLVLLYFAGLYASVFIMVDVRSPRRRVMYLIMLAVLMLVGSVLARFYLIELAGYGAVVTAKTDPETNTTVYNVTVTPIYVDPPYAPYVSTVFAGFSLVPVALALASAVELLGGRR
ncbi:MAG: hypothetical protein QXK07_06225 [Desulfurococcaceae archaeon]